MSKPKDVKVTICPPAEQDEFFQEQQFDSRLADAVNPIAYELGYWHHYPDMGEKMARNANVGLAKSKKKKLKRAEKELEGHENKEAILKILRSE